MKWSCQCSREITSREPIWFLTTVLRITYSELSALVLHYLHCCLLLVCLFPAAEPIPSVPLHSLSQLKSELRQDAVNLY